MDRYGNSFASFFSSILKHGESPATAFWNNGVFSGKPFCASRAVPYCYCASFESHIATRNQLSGKIVSQDSSIASKIIKCTEIDFSLDSLWNRILWYEQSVDFDRQVAKRKRLLFLIAILKTKMAKNRKSARKQLICPFMKFSTQSM
jgi:hypothetical protein